MRVLWEEHKTEEDWGFLLVDVHNAFYQENRTAMLWSVRHEYTSGAQLTFNCYHHWATLVVRDTGDGSGHFLHSKDGVTQGDPLAMIAYGIGVLPLIREMRYAHPRVTQPWYTDYAEAAGMFQQILEHFRDLQTRRPARSYCPETTKSILVVSPGNVARVEEHFWGLGIRVVTGHWYLEGYIGDAEAERGWLQDKTQGWTEFVKILSEVTHKHLQSAYTGLKSPSNRSGLFL